MGTESWTTTSPKRPSVASLKSRAKKRRVVKMSEQLWVVEGDPTLDDHRHEYRVTLPPDSKKFECDCYLHHGGDVRAKFMCSHVMAVILCRKGQLEYVEDVSDLLTSDVEDESLGTASSPNLPASSAEGHDGGGGGSVVPFPSPSVPHPHHPQFGLPPLPDRFADGFRPNQWEAIDEIVDHFRNGTKVVFLGAPTGSGKTLIGETVRRVLDGSTVYACTTKSLQNQIIRDFDYGRTIKGRSNYRTLLRSDLTADDCDGRWDQGPLSCSWCPNMNICPYRVAKEEAAKAPLPVLNMAYYLNETQSPHSLFNGRSLVIIDEADTLEQQLLGFFEVRITPRVRQQLGIKSLPKKTVNDDWARWLTEDVIPAIERRRHELTSQTQLFDDENVELKRERKRLNNLMAQVKLLTDETRGVAGETAWVLETWGSSDKSPQIVFKPVRVTDFAREVLWERGARFLLMSATMISPDKMAEELGLEDDEWEYVDMPSSFPPERRVVMYQPAVAMSHKTKDTDYPKMAKAVAGIIDEYPGVRILVHTNSYDLTRFLWDRLDSDRIVTYWSAQERDRALRDFLANPDSVMLAPSFERGVDLPGEDCEVQVIAKVPYPNLGDKRVNARFYAYGGRTWFAIETIRSIVQATGRGMRSADDWCDTLILDRQFGRLWKDQKSLFPNWWADALVMSVNDPRNRELVDALRERKNNRRRRNPRT